MLRSVRISSRCKPGCGACWALLLSRARKACAHRRAMAMVRFQKRVSALILRGLSRADRSPEKQAASLPAWAGLRWRCDSAGSLIRVTSRWVAETSVLPLDTLPLASRVHCAPATTTGCSSPRICDRCFHFRCVCARLCVSACALAALSHVCGTGCARVRMHTVGAWLGAYACTCMTLYASACVCGWVLTRLRVCSSARLRVAQLCPIVLYGGSCSCLSMPLRQATIAEEQRAPNH